MLMELLQVVFTNARVTTGLQRNIVTHSCAMCWYHLKLKKKYLYNIG